MKTLTLLLLVIASGCTANTANTANTASTYKVIDFRGETWGGFDRWRSSTSGAALNAYKGNKQYRFSGNYVLYEE